MASEVRAFVAMLRGSVRSQLSYPVSFVAELFGQAMNGVIEYAEIYILLHAVPTFAGFGLAQATLLYGLCCCAFGICDMIFGQFDVLARLVRRGELEVLLTRPVSLISQLIATQSQLRRLGRVGFGLVLYLVCIRLADVALTPPNVVLLILAPLGGVLIFGALFLFAGATLLFINQGKQAVNAFTYGGRYVASVPGPALMQPVKLFFTFVVPATLIAYAPAAVLTGTPLPPPWWAGTAWLTVPIGLVMWLVLLAYWRLAVRHYTGAGG